MSTQPFVSLGLSLISLVFSAQVALASSNLTDALIVVAQDSSSSPVSEQINSRIAVTSVVQNLRPYYGSLDIVSEAKLSDSDVTTAIQKRSTASNVDVIILTPLTSSASFVSKVHFKNLRMVYLSGNSSNAELMNWKATGAKLSMAQSDFTSSSVLASERFVYRWGMGWSAQDAAKDAETFSSNTQNTMGNYAIATGKSSLMMTGLNLDRKGGVYSPVSSLQTVPTPAVKTPLYQTSAPAGFGAAVLTASSALMPSVTVNPAAVASPQAFLDRVQPLAWEQMQNLFSTAQSQVPSVNTSSLAQEIWVDGEFLTYILAPVQTWEGGKFASILPLIQGVKLTRSPTNFEISIYFSKSFDVEIADPSKLSNFQLYSVHVPQTVRIQLENTNGVLSLTGLDDGEGESQDRIFLDVKIPVVSNKVYLRTASIELTTGNVTASAGVLGDALGLIAKAQIFSTQVKPKIDIWESIEDNESLFDWPLLTFASE